MNIENELNKPFYSIDTLFNLCVKENCYSLGLALAEHFNIPEKIVFFKFKLGEYEECFNLCEKYNMNRDAYISFVKNKYITYPANLPTKKDLNLPRITFSITTCKRLGLFEKTMNSFLNCCLDWHLIDEWICVDDNSSEEDRKRMKELYPFFKFIFKNPKDKGHPESMNIILENVKSPFLFHMEDDWQFFSKKHYISNCLNILLENETYGQCLINRNYGETENDVLVGGIEKYSKTGLKYYIHEHCTNEAEQGEFNKKYGFKPNCAYWPHFSLRPSLIRTEIFNKIGKFNCKANHFEMDFSYRYRDRGYKSVFFESINSIHIGRLTSQRNDKTKLNAYDLNNETQFRERNLFGKKYNMKTVVVNLDRRKDRWENFIKKEEAKFLCYERFSAVDGSKLKPTEQLQRIFEGNDYNMRQGMVGCALSHIKLAIELVQSSYDIYCIFEDDIDFVSGFQAKLEKILEEKDFDICYLGHHLWKEYRSEEMYDKVKFPELEKWDTKTSLKYSMGGTGGYLLSKQGALKFLQFIEKRGMTNGIDTMQQKACDFLNVFYAKPHLIYSECWNVDPNTDSDIQQNFKSLSIPISTRIENELKLYPNIVRVTHTELKELLTKEKFFTDYYCLLDFNPNNITHKYCYKIGQAVFLLSENSPHLNRLTRLRNFDISEIVYSEPEEGKDYKIISLGDNKHLFDAIGNEEGYPFDLVEGMSFELMYEWVEKTVQDDYEEYLRNILNPASNKVERIPFNGVNCLINEKLGIKFPHEDISILYTNYIAKFENFKRVLNSASNKDINILFIYCTRFLNKRVPEDFEKLHALLSTKNKNVKILTINAISTEYDSPNVSCINVEFPEKFRGEWTPESINYDQNVFRPTITKLVQEISISS